MKISFETEIPYQTSYWRPPLVESKAPSLKNDHHTDVVIIGAGYAGLSSALAIKSAAPALSVTLIEARHVGFGASGRNGGWLVPFPPLYWLIENLDDHSRLASMKFATAFNKRVLGETSRQIKTSSNSEDWREVRHSLVARSGLERAVLLWFKERLDLIGVDCEYFETAASEQPIGYRSKAILDWECTLIHPVKLVEHLFQRALAAGIEIFENTAITSMRKNRASFHMETSDGFKIGSAKVVIATNAYTRSLNLEAFAPPKAQVQHTYMIATEVLDAATLEKISREQKPFGDPSLNYFCGRFHSGRLLFNGGDRKSQASLADDQHETSFRRLQLELVARFPFLRSVELTSAWGGPIYQTASDTPVISEAKEHPGLIWNLGYGGGSGVALALQSGRVVADILLGDQSQDDEAKRLGKILAESRFPPLGPSRLLAGVLRQMLRSPG